MDFQFTGADSLERNHHRRITDGQGNPVEGAVIRLEGTQSRKFITDANGVYRFDNVEAAASTRSRHHE